VIDGNVLTTTSEGTIKVTARVKDGIYLGFDYIQGFNIQIVDTIVPVTAIDGLPMGIYPGDYTLPAYVEPSYATNRTIIWEVKSAGGTGAVVDGKVLTTNSAGTVTLGATIKDGLAQGEDYKKDFTMRISTPPVVYAVAGGFYWRNGKRSNLPGFTDGTMLYIVTDSGKIYILGRDGDSFCYWELENGNATQFDTSGPNTTDEISISQTAVSGGDVYLAGRTIYPAKLYYWKNGEQIDLITPTGVTNLYSVTLTGIAINGEDVYISGYYEITGSPSVYKACYWDKDGNLHDLPYDTTYRNARTVGIAIDKGSVYIWGYQSDDNFIYWGSRTICYWKDGVIVDVDVSGYSDSEDINFTVEDGKVYMTSDRNNRIYYWINDGISTVSGVIVPDGEYYNYATKSIIYEGIIHSSVNGWSFVNGKKADFFGVSPSIIAVRE
jgi:hypothetical protein